uniref:Uncharacterized protein n=1 Tax=Globodera rostochiensis TaxID=31243 RepID=A0A914IE95_GLORO
MHIPRSWDKQSGSSVSITINAKNPQLVHDCEEFGTHTQVHATAEMKGPTKSEQLFESQCLADKLVLVHLFEHAYLLIALNEINNDV